MKKILMSLALVATLAPAAADVLPSQAGTYEGVYSTVSVSTQSKEKIKEKERVLCTIAPDGTTFITSDTGLEIDGTLNAGEDYGFFSFADEFVTNTGIWKFKKNGKIKADMLYGVTPGGNVTFIVQGKLKLKKLKDEVR